MGGKALGIILGALVTGILSAIPFVNFLNICLCGWAIVGGGLAGALSAKSAAEPVSTGSGLTTGAIAGLLGAVIYIIISLPIMYFMDLPRSYGRMLHDAYGRLYSADMDGYIVIGAAFVLSLVLFTVMAGVGGLIATKIFGKKEAVGVPAPPSF